MRNVIEYIEESRELRRSHLELETPCLEIGGNSTHFKGVLAFALQTTIPTGYKINLCHACNNGKCCNPKHLYWGTPLDNCIDRKEAGTQSTFSRSREEMVEHARWVGKNFGGSNKLKDEDLDRYRSVFDSLEKRHGWKTQAAEILGVSHTQVRRIELRLNAPVV